MATKITNPSVVWNSVPIAIVPNSFKFKDGLGETKVEPQSAGGNSVTMVVSQDMTTAKGTFSFEMYPTAENIATVREMKLLPGANGFTITAPSFKRNFLEGTVVNDPEYTLGADGTISVEVESRPGVAG